jgi:transcriptional regulator with XRE-family HTH domain
MELLENLGRRILEKRKKEGLGLRAAAKEIGITHATLSRVEKGFLPDLQTYRKILRWLQVMIPEVSAGAQISAPQIHFRRDRVISPEAAHSLAQMILRAQDAWGLSRKSSETLE